MNGGPSAEKFPHTDLLTDTFLAMEAFTGSPLDLYFGAVLRADSTAPAISELRAAVGKKLEALPSLTLRVADMVFPGDRLGALGEREQAGEQLFLPDRVLENLGSQFDGVGAGLRS